MNRHQDGHDDVTQSLGSSRFLKTVRCRHRNGPVVVKIYIKPDLGLSLSRYQRNSKGMWHGRLPLLVSNEPPHPAEREALLDIPNVYSYQASIDSDKAGYLIRQWVASNLYDRIRWALPSKYVCTLGLNTCP